MEIKTLRFKTVEEEMPQFGRNILIRYKSSNVNYKTFEYYVVCRVILEDGKMVFIEAYGEQYTYWNPEEVVGWMYIEDLDEIE